ncbi:MAG: glycosyltransferase [Fuerstiella sp.]
MLTSASATPTDLFRWFPTFEHRQTPFLILGKGPSYSLRDQFPLGTYNCVSLNHVVREQQVDFAHIIDIDVVEDCEDRLLNNARWLVMPEVPHVNCRPTALCLNDFVQTVPVLSQFAEQGRLLSYPLWSARRPGPVPAVTGTFSGSVVVNLLGRLGVKTVRMLGVDGGGSYSHTFSDLNDRTLFRNQHSSFDIQFSEIQKSVEEFVMSAEPLVDPIRIFVGCDDSMMIPAHVLEYSIRKHTQHPVQVFYMRNMPVPVPKDPKNRPGTGFSFNRFLIPKLAGYAGKAIYVDADMLVFDDIAKLWNTPMDGKAVLCSTQHEVPKGWEDRQNNDHGEGRYWTPGRQMSVMLMDCSQLNWDLDDIIAGLDRGEYSYKELMAEFCILPPDAIGDSIPNEWNCLEWYEEDRSQLVHFTVVPIQPWRNDRSPLCDFWQAAYREALAAGAVPMSVVEESVGRKLVKASLLDIAREVRSSPDARPETASATEVPEEHAESLRLRHMLWDSMIQGYEASAELNRIRSSPAFFLEDMLIRRPAAFGARVYRGIKRRVA